MLRQAHAEARLLPTSLRPHLAPPTPLAPGTWAGRVQCVGSAQGGALSLAPAGCGQEEVDSGRGLGDTARWGRRAIARG